MRALNIAYFIAFISISVGVVNAVLAQSLAAPANPLANQTFNTSQWNLSAPDTALRAQVSPSFFGIIEGALLLGTTINNLSPWPLPPTLIHGLDALSSASVTLAALQFVWRVMLSGGE